MKETKITEEIIRQFRTKLTAEEMAARKMQYEMIQLAYAQRDFLKRRM